MKKTESLITASAVRGYKSICSELRMELRPLTILAGANSSGKSSIMQPALLLKQTLENPFDPGVFRLNGPNGVFGAAGDSSASAGPERGLAGRRGSPPAQAFFAALGAD